MEVNLPSNSSVLRFLTREGGHMYCKLPNVPAFAEWNSVSDAFTSCGCHPEVVSRIWTDIGRKLPRDCRGLIYSNPSLVHAETGIIFALGMGTWYGLRLPRKLISVAIAAGAKTRMEFSTGNMDIRQSISDEWVFGGFLVQELGLCKSAYDYFSLPSDIVGRIERDFVPVEAEPVVELLAQLRRESPDIFGDRVTRSVVFVAKGNFEEFVKAVELARLDWRDLIVQAEYDGWSGEEYRRRDLNMPFEK